MSSYIIIDGELYHHGVKGMKWGVRNKKELKVAKRFAKAGKQQGMADYYAKQGRDAYNKHDSDAKRLERVAESFRSKGKILRAEMAQKSADELRARGSRIQARQNAIGQMYARKASKIQEKANAYATKKRVDLGSSKVNEILKTSAKNTRDRLNTRDALGQNTFGDPLHDAARVFKNRK